MRFSYFWETGKVRGWMGAVIEDGCKIRRLILPRPDRKDLLDEMSMISNSRLSKGVPPCSLIDSVEQYFDTGVFKTTLEAEPDYGTPFQRKVWKETMKIPTGEVRTYGWLAGRVGVNGGARAVGGAVASNPLPIFIP